MTSQNYTFFQVLGLSGSDMQNILVLGCCQTCQRSCDEANALIKKKVPEIQIFSHMYPVLLYNMYDYAVPSSRYVRV